MTDDDQSWRRHAPCRLIPVELVSAIFFPERNASHTPARNMCRECIVREQCLDYAIEHDEKFGIWGGTTERERRIIKRQRAKERRQRKAS